MLGQVVVLLSVQDSLLEEVLADLAAVLLGDDHGDGRAGAVAGTETAAPRRAEEREAERGVVVICWPLKCTRTPI